MYQYLLLLDTEQERKFFKELYREHKNEMYYIALKILNNESDAEDMVHETFRSEERRVGKECRL